MVFAGLPNYTQVGLHKGLRSGTGVVMAMPMKMNPRIKSNEQITTNGNTARAAARVQKTQPDITGFPCAPLREPQRYTTSLV